MTDSSRSTEHDAPGAATPGPVADGPRPDGHEGAEHQDRTGGEPADRREPFVGTGFFWGLIVGLSLATLVIILAAQNTASVTVHFLGWRIDTPLIVVILGALLAGIVLDEIAGAIYRRRRRRILNERAELERLRGASDKG